MSPSPPVRPSAPSRLVVGAAVLDDLTAPTQVLCARRSAPPALAGRWELPGGKVEPGESPTEALHRELLEELGVLLVLGPRLVGPADGDWPIPSTSAPDRRMRVHLATLDPAGPAPRTLQDHDALEWRGGEDVTSLDWLDGDVPIAAALARLLRPRP